MSKARHDKQKNLARATLVQALQREFIRIDSKTCSGLTMHISRHSYILDVECVL